MSKTIYLDPFDPASVSACIREIEAYKKWVIEKTHELAERLAKFGLQRVQVGYAVALYDEDKTQRDVVLTVEERVSDDGSYHVFPALPCFSGHSC